MRISETPVARRPSHGNETIGFVGHDVGNETHAAIGRDNQVEAPLAQGVLKGVGKCGSPLMRSTVAGIASESRLPRLSMVTE